MFEKDPLRSLPFFNDLSDSFQQELASNLIESDYAKGEYVFREGDPTEWFHIVKEGTVKCVKSSPDGRDVTLKFLMPGDLFCCEAAVFDGSPHPGCAKVMDHARILKIKKQAYYDILRRNPEAAIQVISYLGHRLREAQEHAKAFAFDRAEQRIASILVGLADKAGVQEAEGIRLTIRLTRKDLADMAGLTVETATRIMSRLKQQGLIVGTAKRLILTDLCKISRLAHVLDCPTSGPT